MLFGYEPEQVADHLYFFTFSKIKSYFLYFARRLAKISLAHVQVRKTIEKSRFS